MKTSPSTDLQKSSKAPSELILKWFSIVSTISDGNLWSKYSRTSSLSALYFVWKSSFFVIMRNFSYKIWHFLSMLWLWYIFSFTTVAICATKAPLEECSNSADVGLEAVRESVFLVSAGVSPIDWVAPIEIGYASDSFESDSFIETDGLLDRGPTLWSGVDFPLASYVLSVF